ncbi:MAG: hypothetical protein J7L89_05195, partial [Bacteroidales bacterium]|nr:hypothetical protein [Bacteroidales bacterium]
MKRIVGVLFLLCDMIIAPAHGQELLYRTGRWNADSLGNHRVVVEVKKNAAAVRCIIPWRRRDVNPQDKEVLIYSAADSSSPINNRILQKITRESGTIIFQPVTGAGTYYLYYLPYRTKGRNYPTVTYLKPVNRADAAWVRKTMLKRDRLPEARPVAMEAINSFNSFYPMEVIATQSEINRLLYPAGSGTVKPYYLFPELRDYPVRMWDAIPYRWIKKGLTYRLSDTVQQNEYFAFQIAVFAYGQSVSNLEITYDGLKTADGHRIPAGKFTCFNKEGNNWDQITMVKTIQIPKGKIQPLWFGVDVAENQSPGIYTGRVTIHPEGMEPQSVTLSLTVQPGILPDRGDNEPWKHSRLRWLNSDIAVDDGIIPPYNPIEVEGSTLKILGREIHLGADGLPAQILSFFTQEMTRLDTHRRKLLVSPMDFMVKDENGLFSEKTSGVTFTKKSEGVVEWAAEFSMSDPVSQSSQLRFELTGHLEFDGFLTYQVKVTAPATTPVENISFQIPICSDRVQYMLGLGRQGGVAPERFTYLWDPFYNCDGPWLGSVNAGLQATFRAGNYERPLNTNFYH